MSALHNAVFGLLSYIEDKGFGWLKSSDFYMKGITVVAAMMAKDIDTGKGKAKIWDLIKKMGNWMKINLHLKDGKNGKKRKNMSFTRGNLCVP